MRNRRQSQVDRAVAECLRDAEPYALPESILKADAGRKVVPRALESELAEAIRYHDGAGRLVSDPGEVEHYFKLSQAGRMWLAEQR